jgi:site-specific recombinase XerD
LVHHSPDLNIEALVSLVTDAVDSPHTRRAYGRSIREFLEWYTETNQVQFTKATVQRYVSKLRSDGITAGSINQRLVAIRRLAREAADNHAMRPEDAASVASVGSVKQRGKRLGHWLSRDQVTKLLAVPDVSTLGGLRDRAILAVLVGCGLRRAELAGLTFEQIQQREGRWMITDLVGKGNKLRSVPMPAWAKVAVNGWAKAADLHSGKVFRRVNKAGKLTGDSLTAQAIRNVVSEAGQVLGVELAPHDLRRTFAKLAHKGGAALDQIQLSLGHASIQTTERYLGIDQDLADAPCDHLGIGLAA